MDKIIVDARGLSCPQPVILARRAIREGAFPIEVWVDTATSRDNVTRAAEKLGCTVQAQEADEGFRLILRR
ncbi:MAG TPA: SirA family protein [Chloroflexi bacterium]|jgi:tRNA 2-thiouridine synthesizing protein A|nr:SirA family protein [Chloroflexota bacterium]